LKASVKNACFDLLRLNPKGMAALGAPESISPFHFCQPCPNIFVAGSIYQPIEGGNTGRASYKNLKSAWVITR
jgi:hypothetical protein